MSKYLFIIPIGLLYGLFFSTTFDFAYNYDAIENMCKYNDNDNECHVKREEEFTKYYNIKLITMLVIGFLGLIIGMLVYKYAKNENVNSAALGVALGGIITILFYGISNVTNKNKLLQIGSIGITILGLVIGSVFLTV